MTYVVNSLALGRMYYFAVRAYSEPTRPLFLSVEGPKTIQEPRFNHHNVNSYHQTFVECGNHNGVRVDVHKGTYNNQVQGSHMKSGAMVKAES